MFVPQLSQIFGSGIFFARVASRKDHTQVHGTSMAARAEPKPQVTWQDKADSNTLDTVLKDICAREEALYSEQRQLLETFVLRIKREKLEGIAHNKKQKTDPLFDMIHGYPGTGKSRVFKTNPCA